ncbi:hypothetical protein M431DRAFT_427026 [Trichoderma harzianum CBS 226.95]|uniref:Uncharacterized protein n=1 Tax=Trichoderma harzianum CBS 226.95 TaxID=983964 RepID=A0A2T4ACB0_TRIHA|nr:hypothetical protein M431DRAFT_427026 [Trichoderma harzianum CBS 226.95]PTB54720.1 hypothetical protein M431DRAFT_427026 [Trichoderma harzianum CBS 226.95]
MYVIYINVSHKALLFERCSLLTLLFRTSLAERAQYSSAILSTSTVRLNLAIDVMVSFHNEAMFTAEHSRLSNKCYEIEYIYVYLLYF